MRTKRKCLLFWFDFVILIHAMRLIGFKHILCNTISKSPRLAIDFNLEYLQDIENKCADFEIFMKQNAKEYLKTRYLISGLLDRSWNSK